ncbi:hypothetical protein D3Y57_04740 (plasmid) [Sphingomonas paeninsulae]|uniref:Uncharacterized protein n=1 Tax=Sphingomonas paeninsulae TaxID=2319844 RepID=A0A494T7M2_SPHPE|nr:hypothetical protein [Sphingomonas paeninsulae]AYJ85327.1 hypothetical protein D3Y57_04740 [Sphingomonas paeninsulae]
MSASTCHPWNANEGRFDQPSSGKHVSKFQTQAKAAPSKYIAQRLANAARGGLAASDAGTICARIDEALTKLKTEALGVAAYICLADADMMAFRDAVGGDHWKGVRVTSCAASKVHASGGKARAVRKRLGGRA